MTKLKAPPGTRAVTMGDGHTYAVDDTGVLHMERAEHHAELRAMGFTEGHVEPVEVQSLSDADLDHLTKEELIDIVRRMRVTVPLRKVDHPSPTRVDTSGGGEVTLDKLNKAELTAYIAARGETADPKATQAQLLDQARQITADQKAEAQE